MTSVDLITTETWSPCLRPRSSTASTVIIEVSTWPPMSTRTWAATAPFLISTTLPLSTLRALSFMAFSPLRTISCGSRAFGRLRSRAVVVHAAETRDVVAAELLGALVERRPAAEREQLLQRRLEIIAPPHREVVALAKQRHEAQTKLARHRLDGESGIGFALGDREGDVRFAARGRLDRLEPARVEPGFAHQVIEQQMTARALLARDQGPALEIAELGHALGVAGRDDQALRAPGPFHQHHRHARHGALDVTAVPVLGLGLVDVEAGGDRLAGGEASKPVQAAVEERRELAAGFAKRPFQERIVTAGEHRRAA